MKLLVVDDSLIVRNAIERSVANPEITEIHQARDGAEALLLFAQYQPEMVTMDLTMPHMDGLTCIQEIRKIKPKTSILVISALNSHKTAMDAIKRGACGFLVKPFTPLELTEAVAQLVSHAKR